MKETKSKTMKHRITYIGVVVGLVVATFFGGKMLIGYVNHKKIPVAATENKVKVETFRPKRMEIIPKLSYKATMEPRDTGIISSKISGRITQVMFENGMYVEKDTPLVVLDDQDFKNQLNVAQNQLEAAKNQLVILTPGIAKAEKNLEVAKRNFDRLKERYEAVEIPKEEFEKALDAFRWKKFDELMSGHSFDLDVVIVYGLKLQILDRHHQFASPKGQEKFVHYKEVEIFENIHCGKPV